MLGRDEIHENRLEKFSLLIGSVGVILGLLGFYRAFIPLVSVDCKVLRDLETMCRSAQQGRFNFLALSRFAELFLCLLIMCSVTQYERYKHADIYLSIWAAACAASMVITGVKRYRTDIQKTLAVGNVALAVGTSWVICRWVDSLGKILTGSNRRIWFLPRLERWTGATRDVCLKECSSSDWDWSLPDETCSPA